MFIHFADKSTYYTFKLSTISAIRYGNGDDIITIDFIDRDTEIFRFADAESAAFTYHNSILRQLKGE